MTDTTLDWRTLAAGRELDRIVAERLGWRFAQTSDYPHWEVFRPDGTAVLSPRRINQWENSHLAIAGYVFPAFSTSADVALSLFAVMPDDCTPRVVRMLRPMGDHMGHIWKGCIIVDDHNFPVDVIEHEADTPALAICRAWLAWKDGAK